MFNLLENILVIIICAIIIYGIIIIIKEAGIIAILAIIGCIVFVIFLAKVFGIIP
jgi:hypothetical protein